MNFLKYIHIARFGTSEVEGIESGVCFLFPKLDGTNASVWLDDTGQIAAGSRRRELSLKSDNAGFFAKIKKDDNLNSFLYRHPNLRLYGEWLVPHTIKDYRENAWREFYIFDVLDPYGNFFPYNQYAPVLHRFGLKFIPPLRILENPTGEDLRRELSRNKYLIKNDASIGEGIVIKNYNFKNKYGRVVWAKMVSDRFEEKHVPDRKKVTNSGVEQKIVNRYLTNHLVEKNYAKIIYDVGYWRSEFIPRLLHTIYYELITEEMWDILKKFKSPVINFKELRGRADQRIKLLKPEIF